MNVPPLHFYADAMLGIDLGCGSKKRSGFVGLDYVAAEGSIASTTCRRIVCLSTTAPSTRSSRSHFLEHIENAPSVLQDIVKGWETGGARRDLDPYQKSNIAFLPGTSAISTRSSGRTSASSIRKVWFRDIEGMLRLDRFHYVVSKHTEEQRSAKCRSTSRCDFSTTSWWSSARSLTVLKGKEYLDKAKYKQSVKPPALTVGPGRELSRPLDAPQMFWRIDL